jgi:hypothetical protein
MVVDDVEPHPLKRQTSSVPLARTRSGKEAMLAIVLCEANEQSSRHLQLLENPSANLFATQSHEPMCPERAF